MGVGGWSNLGCGGPDIMGVVMKGGQEGMGRGRRGSGVIGSTHVCGSVSGVVPDVVHQGGEVLQAVWDVVRKQQDAHRLRTHTHRVKDQNVVFWSLCSSSCSLYLWPRLNVGDVHPQSGLYSIS